jgi:hypothetical protein
VSPAANNPVLTVIVVALVEVIDIAVPASAATNVYEAVLAEAAPPSIAVCCKDVS